MARRVFVAGALERLSSAPDARTTPRHLRSTLASSLMDPHLDVVYKAPRGSAWIGEDGRRASPPTAAAGQVVTDIAAGGGPLAALVHDRELAYERKLMDAARAYVVTAME